MWERANRRELPCSLPSIVDKRGVGRACRLAGSGGALHHNNTTRMEFIKLPALTRFIKDHVIKCIMPSCDKATKSPVSHNSIKIASPVQEDHVIRWVYNFSLVEFPALQNKVEEIVMSGFYPHAGLFYHEEW